MIVKHTPATCRYVSIYTRIRFSLQKLYCVLLKLMITTSSCEVNVDAKNFQDLDSLLCFGIKIFVPVAETLQQHTQSV